MTPAVKTRARKRGHLSTLPHANGYAEGINPGDAEQVRQPRVALLVDYPILMRAVRGIDPEAVPRLADIVRAARELGAVMVARAYGAWYDVDEATTAFTEGLDPVFVPPAGPGVVPTTGRLVSDGLSLLETEVVDALALSGDDRLLPLVEAAVHKGLPVSLIAHSCQPEGPCLVLATSSQPAAGFARQLTRAERYRRPNSAA
jgi:hypothetical protein